MHNRPTMSAFCSNQAFTKVAICNIPFFVLSTWHRQSAHSRYFFPLRSVFVVIGETIHGLHANTWSDENYRTLSGAANHAIMRDTNFESRKHSKEGPQMIFILDVFLDIVRKTILQTQRTCRSLCSCIKAVSYETHCSPRATRTIRDPPRRSANGGLLCFSFVRGSLM